MIRGQNAKVIEMTCDNDLIDCVGRDNMINTCKELGCMLYITCSPRNGHTELCTECYAEIEKRYPECIEG